MSYKPVAQELARYNHWQNGQMMGICDTLNAAELERNQGLFFKSILATLDHVLYVDRVLIGIFCHGVVPAFDPATRLSNDYNDYKNHRYAEDDGISAICNDASDTWFEETVTLENKALNRSRVLPRWFHASQMFNHQTHHRSQVTSALHRLGLDYGNTDLPYNPMSAY
ncbi:MAG: DinB family protein [Parvibaculum sp.]